MTREDKRLLRRIVLLAFFAFGLLLMVGAANLWLFPPPEWASEALKQSYGDLCRFRQTLVRCDAMCRSDGKWELCKIPTP
jgi:hypothetical protein